MRLQTNSEPLRKMPATVNGTLSRLLLLSLLLLLGATGSACRASQTTAYRVEDVPNVHLSDARQYVSDPTGILSASARDTLNRLCLQLDQAKGIETAIVMLPDIEDGDIFTFAHNLFRTWGIGNKKQNNGLLIVFVADLRQVRFTTGYGLEGTLPDALCKRIQTRYMIPHFRQGDYDGGMVAAMRAISQTLTQDPTLEKARQEKLNGDDDDFPVMVFLVLALVLFPLVCTWIANRRTRCPHCGQRQARHIGTRKQLENGQWTVIDIYRCQHCFHQFERRNRDNNNHGNGRNGNNTGQDLMNIFLLGSLFGNGRGGGGFSGGSFGGGSTGGGGSTSDW